MAHESVGLNYWNYWTAWQRVNVPYRSTAFADTVKSSRTQGLLYATIFFEFDFTQPLSLNAYRKAFGDKVK